MNLTTVPAVLAAEQINNCKADDDKDDDTVSVDEAELPTCKILY